MNRLVLTKINACFLAIVFLAGTFAAITPSFIIGVNAQAESYGMDQKYNTYEPDYGMHNSYDNKQSYGKDSNSYDKSKDSSTIVKKVKCNNINVNVNGFNGVEVGTLPTALSDLATNEAQAADEGEVGASSSGSGGSGSDGAGRPSGSDNDSRFVCINNNDFAVTEGNGDETDPCGNAIEACFERSLGDQFDMLSDALNSPEGITIEINGVDVTLNSFGDLCSELRGLTFDDLLTTVSRILTAAGISVGSDVITTIAECIEPVLAL